MKQYKTRQDNLRQETTIYAYIKKRPYLWFRPNDTLYEIVNAMRKKHSYAALVVENHSIVGLLTEHKILLYLITWFSSSPQSQERVMKAFNVLKAGDVMIRNPQVIDSDETMDDAFETVIQSGFRYIPVVKNNEPVGIINRNELIQYMTEEKRKELESKDMMLSYLMNHENYGGLS